MSSPGALLVSRVAARRFLRRALGLDVPHPTIAAALAHHGYVQIDPINVCGRMHDLILRNRVAGYREGDLMRYLHGEVPNAKSLNSSGCGVPPQIIGGTPMPPGSKPASAATKPLAADARTAFEHHVPGTGILVAFPFEAWPHLLGAMRSWSLGRGAWAGRLTRREQDLAKHLLAEITARGPLGSDHFDEPRRAPQVWGVSKLAKAVLQKLFFHGRILIAGRDNNRRRYDLPERVLPAAMLAQPAAPAAETARWLALIKLRQRRLVMLKRDELRLVADEVQPVAVEGCPLLYCLRKDASLLEGFEASELSTLNPQLSTPPRLLAPLDPLIYDRRLTAALWDFAYTWEAYTPPLKRVRGYYALPVLAGTEIVGHVDPKADRMARKLIVVSRRIQRGHALTPATREFARWLGLK